MYLAHYSYGTIPKNNLEAMFSNYLKTLDRTLIDNKDVEDFKLTIIKEYAFLCDKHSRCRPVEKNFHEMRGDFYLHGTNCEFKLLKSK